MEQSADKIGGLQLYKTQSRKILSVFDFFISVAFVLHQNDSAPWIL